MSPSKQQKTSSQLTKKVALNVVIHRFLISFLVRFNLLLTLFFNVTHDIVINIISIPLPFHARFVQATNKRELAFFLFCNFNIKWENVCVYICGNLINIKHRSDDFRIKIFQNLRRIEIFRHFFHFFHFFSLALL